MNFIEAVTELKEGRCRGIKLNSTFFNGDEFRVDLSERFSDDWELVNPVVQYEEVEVIRFLCSKCDTVYTDSCGCCNKPAIRLTGIIKREIKPKVKRRMLLKEANYPSIKTSMFPFESEVYAEWEE